MQLKKVVDTPFRACPVRDISWVEKQPVRTRRSVGTLRDLRRHCTRRTYGTHGNKPSPFSTHETFLWNEIQILN